MAPHHRVLPKTCFSQAHNCLAGSLSSILSMANTWLSVCVLDVGLSTTPVLGFNIPPPPAVTSRALTQHFSSIGQNIHHKGGHDTQKAKGSTMLCAACSVVLAHVW